MSVKNFRHMFLRYAGFLGFEVYDVCSVSLDLDVVGAVGPAAEVQLLQGGVAQYTLDSAFGDSHLGSRV